MTFSNFHKPGVSIAHSRNSQLDQALFFENLEGTGNATALNFKRFGGLIRVDLEPRNSFLG